MYRMNLQLVTRAERDIVLVPNTTCFIHFAGEQGATKKARYVPQAVLNTIHEIDIMSTSTKLLDIFAALGTQGILS